MNLVRLFRIIGYVTSVVLFIFGLILLTGVFDFFRFRNLPSNFRVMFGVVFIHYGIYRFVRLKFVRKNDVEDDL
jgi:uncharacterized membrane protein YdcZ (DUF606 family)